MEPAVKEWMSGDPVCIEAEASALEALELMVERGIRHLPVVDTGGLVIGLVSIDDLRAELPFEVSRGRLPDAKQRDQAREWRVQEVMTPAPCTVHENASLLEAAETLRERRIGCLPVVDEQGRLSGVLSETDALDALASALSAERARN
ncbi:MAG: CBS domain-containing protein [Myxococcota bacterium]|nr:CBS domain-containing protein [Myxococcota bacterium]